MVRFKTPPTPPDVSEARLDRELALGTDSRYIDFWKRAYNQFLDLEVFDHPFVSLEIGSGTGHFIDQLAKLNPHHRYIAIERCRHRGKKLIKKAQKTGGSNFKAYRGNIVPAILNGLPAESLDQIFILYPPPWYKNNQRKHRWYLHPVMAPLVSALKPGGQMIWASDQKYYIEEASYVSRQQYHLNILKLGPVSEHPKNELVHFPMGRTKFEEHFLAAKMNCYELIAEKPPTLNS